MSTVTRWAVDEDVAVLGTSKVSISTATTSNFDFGTPNDLDLANTSAYEDGARVLVVFAATTTGTTDTVSFSVQDAADNAGSIGTPGTASTSGTLTGGTGDQYAVASVQVRAGKPWMRFRVTSDGATDTFACTCTVLGVGNV